MIAKPTIPILFLAFTSMHATVLIDPFTTVSGPQIVVLPPGGSSDSSTNANPDVFGGTRQISIAGLVAPGGASEAVVSMGASGAAELVNGLGSRAEMEVRWNANGLGLPEDFNAAGNFSLTYAADRPTVFVLRLIDGTKRPFESAFLVGPGSGTLSWGENGSLFPELHLDDVFEIALRIEPALGGDVWMDDFVLVPEPGAWAFLFALGLGAYAASRWQRVRGGKP